VDSREEEKKFSQLANQKSVEFFCSAFVYFSPFYHSSSGLAKNPLLIPELGHLYIIRAYFRTLHILVYAPPFM
jgi:hypothetical protein